MPFYPGILTHQATLTYLQFYSPYILLSLITIPLEPRPISFTPQLKPPRHQYATHPSYHCHPPNHRRRSRHLQTRRRRPSRRLQGLASLLQCRQVGSPHHHQSLHSARNCHLIKKYSPAPTPSNSASTSPTSSNTSRRSSICSTTSRCSGARAA